MYAYMISASNVHQYGGRCIDVDLASLDWEGDGVDVGFPTSKGVSVGTAKGAGRGINWTLRRASWRDGGVRVFEKLR